MTSGGSDDREASCNRKHRHEVKFDAVWEAERLEAEIPGKHFEAYFCGLCFNWHVGSVQ